MLHKDMQYYIFRVASERREDNPTARDGWHHHTETTQQSPQNGNGKDSAAWNPSWLNAAYIDADRKLFSDLEEKWDIQAEELEITKQHLGRVQEKVTARDVRGQETRRLEHTTERLRVKTKE